MRGAGSLLEEETLCCEGADTAKRTGATLDSAKKQQKTKKRICIQQLANQCNYNL